MKVATAMATTEPSQRIWLELSTSQNVLILGKPVDCNCKGLVVAF